MVSYTKKQERRFAMIDFHSHILPQIDDGAQSVEESIEMLKMLKNQGVNTVCLTPHYIAMDESPKEFLERRDEAFKALKEAIESSIEELPKLLLGAEVYYYPGICRMEEIDSLKLENTELLLLEMPMAPWSEYTIREILDLINSSNTKVVIAHIERAMGYQKRGTVERLIDSGVLMQTNASFFNMRKTRRAAFKMFNSGLIHFLGSDCHSVKHRPPRIEEAVSAIKDKFSQNAVDEFFEEQKDYFK